MIRIELSCNRMPCGAVEAEKGITPRQLLPLVHARYPVYACRIAHRYERLDEPLTESCTVEFGDLRDPYGNMAYQGSLTLMYMKAVHDILGKDVRITIANSLSKGLFTRIHISSVTDEVAAKIQKRMEELELQSSKLELQKSELDEQKGMIEKLQKQQEELAEQLKHAIPDEVMQLKRQIQGHQEHIEQTADMTDAQLMAWVDLQMDETKLYTDTNLTLKTMARALGLTQKRLAGLFKDHPKYNSLGEYINEKRFLYACQLLREEPNWTIEAVGAEAGFGGRRTFQTEVKRRLGITPSQYRQSQSLQKKV